MGNLYGKGIKCIVLWSLLFAIFIASMQTPDVITIEDPLKKGCKTLSSIPQEHSWNIELTSRGSISRKEAQKIRPSAVSQQEKETTADGFIHYTKEEKRMLECVVAHEAGVLSVRHQTIIVNLILNRVKSNRFPNTIKEVLEAPGQFTAIRNYYHTEYEPSEKTKEAVREVLNGECQDLSNGATYYCSPKYMSETGLHRFEKGKKLVLEDREGIYLHRFYK